MALDAARRLVVDRPFSLVTGYFDPLLAEHARRLGEIAALGRPLMVALLTPEDPILDTAARAEMVAALSAVDYVVPAETAELMPPEHIFHEESADLRRRRDLIRRVHSRQAAC